MMPSPIEIVFTLDERQQITRQEFGLTRMIEGMIARGQYEERKVATMPVSTGNYDAEGVNRYMFPARTESGEQVVVVNKTNRANQSTVALAEDGTIYEVVGTKLRELTGEARDVAEQLLKDEAEIARSHGEPIKAELAESRDEIAASLGEAKGEIVDSLSEAADEIKESVSEASGVVQKEVAAAVDEMKDKAEEALDAVNPFDDDDDEPEAA